MQFAEYPIQISGDLYGMNRQYNMHSALTKRSIFELFLLSPTGFRKPK